LKVLKAHGILIYINNRILEGALVFLKGSTMIRILTLCVFLVIGIYASPSIFASPVADDFNGTTLNPAWIVQTPSAGTTVQTTGDGRLHIQTNTDNSDLWTAHNVNAPRLYQAVASTANWIVDTKMHFSATSTYQEAGIMVTVSDGLPEWGGYLRMTTAVYSWDTSEFIKFLSTNVSANFDDIYFRLQKDGNQYTSWYGFDGQSFTSFGTRTLSYTVTGVGLFAIRQDSIGPDPEGAADNTIRSTAYFDYFDVNGALTSPAVPEPLSGVLFVSSLVGIRFAKRRC
jgi:regulation of enolase protein 1 (concanavalin A-like superfamily)